MERPKQTQIFTDEFRQRISKFTSNMYGDYEGLVLYTLISMAILTGLLAFWQMTGQYGIIAYTEYWATTYPTTPIHESFIYQTFRIIGPLTQGAVTLIWCVFFIVLCVITIKNINQPTARNKKETGNDEPKVSPPSQKRVSSLADKTCPYCKSIKTKPGGKNHPGQTYCKSCRKYF